MPAMSVNEWFVLGSNAKPILMSMQKDMPSSNDVVVMRRTITNGTPPTAVKLLKRDEKEKDEEEEKNIKYRRQTSELVIETRGSKVFDNNLSKKFAFLSASSAPDYRPYSYGDRVQNKQEKTNTNQSTKIQQLQSIFGQNATTTTTSKENGIEHSNILDNTALIHAENEVRIEYNLGIIKFTTFSSLSSSSIPQLKKIIQTQSEDIKNLRNQLKTSDKRIRELEFEVKKLRLEHHN